MPTYEYKCDCGNIVTKYNERFDAAKEQNIYCDNCKANKIMKRIISQNGFIFNCEGFYNSRFPDFKRPTKFKKDIYNCAQEGCFNA